VVLITGGAGYLGGRIADYLVSLGIKVRVGSRSDELENMPMDFSDDLSLQRACKGIKTIIHLAAMNAGDCEKNPEKALLVNGLGTLKLLQAAEQEGVSKFIYFSTAHVYNSPLQGMLDEKTLPRPLHSYSITHRVAEDYVLEADRKGKLSGVVFRVTNAVGSPISYEANCWMLVVNDLCRQVVVDKCMRLRSDDSIQRDFIPISVICSVVHSFLNSSVSGEVINLSSGQSMSLRMLTDLIIERTKLTLGYFPEVFFGKERKNIPVDVLEISNDKLLRTVGGYNMDLSGEIDQLLLNCSKWFGNT